MNNRKKIEKAKAELEKCEALISSASITPSYLNEIDGAIRICCFGERRIKVSFIPTGSETESYVQVSDRSLRYILAMFRAEIDGSADLKAAAQKVYPHPLAPCSTTALEDCIPPHSQIIVSVQGSMLQAVRVTTQIPRLEFVTGLYLHRGIGSTIEEAILQTKSAEPQLLPIHLHLYVSPQ